MSKSTDIEMMRWPLIISAAVLVIRIVLEQVGAPSSISNIFGVTWLYILVPIYFATRITVSNNARPFKSLLKHTFLYTTYQRLMVIPIYMLAYALSWQAPRFSINQGGNVGEGVSALTGYLIVPFRNALIWIAIGTIVGMIFGSTTVFIRRRFLAKEAVV